MQKLKRRYDEISGNFKTTSVVLHFQLHNFGTFFEKGPLQSVGVRVNRWIGVDTRTPKTKIRQLCCEKQRALPLFHAYKISCYQSAFPAVKSARR